MDICKQIEDIVWSESEDVWNETFTLLMLNENNHNALVNVVMKWILRMIAEYETRHTKILDILDKMTCSSEGVETLEMHYQRIVSRFKSVHSCCTAIECLL
jgi:hypothetical protein